MRITMRIAAALIVAACGPGVAQSRPVIIEESGVLEPPPGTTYVWSATQVGTNGEYALIDAAYPQEPNAWIAQTFDALLYRRVNGSWVFQRILAQGSRSSEDYSYFPVIIGMKGNLASVELGTGGSDIYRFDGTDWVNTHQGAGLHEDVSIDGERVLYGVGEAWNGQVFEPDGAGGWVSTYLPGQPRCCDDEFWGGPVDLLGNRAILATPYTYDLEPQEIPIYQGNAQHQWSPYVKLQVPLGEFRLGSEVALHANNAIVNARRSGGPFIWANGSFYGQPTGRLQTVNAYARNARILKFAKEGNLLLASAQDPDFGTVIINVFRWDETRSQYDRVAILKPKGGGGLNGSFEIDGNTVVAAANPRAFVFELPAVLADPQPRYENFESGNGANWTAGPGSQFTVVRPTAANQVFRQSSVTGDAHAVLGDTAWMHQAIEADVKPFAFGCADCWVGLATRYADPQNYYYVTLRHSGSVQLKRMRNGAFTTLASAPLSVPLSRTYRVRLESIGNRHRVYIDGKQVLSADDTGPVVAGNAALIMFKAKADYDNVAVSPTPRGTLFADDFADPATYQGDWTHNGSGQWNHVNGVLAQTSVAAEARALIGTPTDDQSVAFRVRPTAFALTDNGQERWVGAIARYRDDRNYYYLTLRSGGTLSLRKLVNGVITPIRDVPAGVNLGSWYSLRLEAMGSSLRGYLNGALVIQATDTAHTSGRGGAMTYKAAAEFDDYLAYQP